MSILNHASTHIPDEAVQAMPKRIYAKTHGASTDVISGQRGLIGGWNEHKRDGQIEFVRADVAALPHLSAPCAVEVPEGWQLVPKDPTFEMAKAAIDLDPKSDLDAKYKAMLSAAPQIVTKPVDVAAGLEQAAKFLDQRVHAYVHEHGMTDPSTGVVEFPGWGDEYVSELEDLAEAIRALSAEPAQGDQWQPIETAPKTGQFLAWSPRNGGCQMVWNAERFSKANEPFMPEHLRAEHWTHWMPLPAAPTSEVGK